MHILCQTGGLCGFTKHDESEFDPFGVGHSSTSISAGLGLAVGRDLQGRRNSSHWRWFDDPRAGLRGHEQRGVLRHKHDRHPERQQAGVVAHRHRGCASGGSP